MPRLIELRHEFETYRQGLKPQSQYWIFTDEQSPDGAGKLSRFRETGRLDFRIELDDLLSGRFECKVDGIAVALVGATSSDPMINCVLMHDGTSDVRRLDGTVAHYDWPPSGRALLAARTEAEISTIPSLEPEGFWGRSPAAKWHLFIEPEVMASSAVNLSGVTKIIVGVSYKAFNRSLGAKTQAGARAD